VRKTMNKCAKCGHHKYCSKECQVRHWCQHKRECKDAFFATLLAKLARLSMKSQMAADAGSSGSNSAADSAEPESG
jgi:hypothetical protein